MGLQRNALLFSLAQLLKIQSGPLRDDRDQIGMDRRHDGASQPFVQCAVLRTCARAEGTQFLTGLGHCESATHWQAWC